MKRMIIALGLSLFAALSAQAIEFQAGKDYEVIPAPVATHNNDKIEVTEVFWYGCIHCFRFEPMVRDWKNSLPDDVEFIRVPAMWNKRLRIHAQAYYTAQKLGVSQQVHQPLFDALNVEKQKLATEAELTGFFAKFGVPVDDFHHAFSSSEVQKQLDAAAEKSQAYGVQGTPELIINGKYRISARTAGGQSEMLAIADYLIDKERAANAPASPSPTHADNSSNTQPSLSAQAATQQSTSESEADNTDASSH